jgi:lysophospholipase L1-like esterase
MNRSDSAVVPLQVPCPAVSYFVTRDARPRRRNGRVRWIHALLASVLWLAPAAAHAAPTPTTRWILAEGAANDFFTEDILIGNPNAAAVQVKITLLPQDDSGNPGTPIVIPNFQVNATSRYTFHVNAVPNLTSGSLSAVVECASCTGDQGIVVERTMTWSDSRKRGGHNSQGVLTPSTDWFLAEGTVGFFQTFVLIANPDPTQTAQVEVTYLREFSGPLVQTFTMGPNTRRTIYVNGGVDIGGTTTFFDQPFSVAVHSANGVGLVVERAMYWNGFEGGHEATAVPTASTTWLFSEGATGGPSSFFWDTFLLLANPGNADAQVTLTFFRDAGVPVTCQAVVGAHHRKTIYTNNLGDAAQQLTCDAPALMKSAAFSTKIVSTQPIVAERAMYWTSNGNVWIDGHDTPGVTEEASKWAFAEGDEGHIDESGINYNSFFLFSNSSGAPVPLKATFMREDGTGVVKQYTIQPQSRFTLPTQTVIEVSNQKFSAFFESENGATFVAERAVYWGDGYYGGHGSTGTPWTGTIATPPPVNLTPVVVATGIAPNHGPLAGGTQVTISGSGFTSATTVLFGTVQAAVSVNSANTLTAISPAAAQAGAVNVTIANPGFPITTVPAGFTYDAPVVTGPFTTADVSLAFGDSITFGTTTTLFTDPNSGFQTIFPGSTTSYGERLRVLMSDRYRNQNITVNVRGVPGECVTRDCGQGTWGTQRLPTQLTPAQDLVIIMQGVNDLNNGFSIDSIINGLRTMILTARNAGKPVIICSLTPVKARETDPNADPVFWKANPFQVTALNRRIEDLKTELNVPRVDMFNAFGGGDFNSPMACNGSASCRALLSPDGLHPNAAGYQKMAEAIFQKIQSNFEFIAPVTH